MKTEYSTLSGCSATAKIKPTSCEITLSVTELRSVFMGLTHYPSRFITWQPLYPHKYLQRSAYKIFPIVGAALPTLNYHNFLKNARISTIFSPKYKATILDYLIPNFTNVLKQSISFPMAMFGSVRTAVNTRICSVVLNWINKCLLIRL